MTSQQPIFQIFGIRDSKAFGVLGKRLGVEGATNANRGVRVWTAFWKMIRCLRIRDWEISAHVFSVTGLDSWPFWLYIPLYCGFIYPIMLCYVIYFPYVTIDIGYSCQIFIARLSHPEITVKSYMISPYPVTWKSHGMPMVTLWWITTGWAPPVILVVNQEIIPMN